MRKKPAMTGMVMPEWVVLANGFGGHGMTVEDIFSSFGDIFGDAFGGFGGFGGGGRRGKRVSKGTNLRVKVKLTLQEIAIRYREENQGNKVRYLRYLQWNRCSRCIKHVHMLNLPWIGTCHTGDQHNARTDADNFRMPDMRRRR